MTTMAEKVRSMKAAREQALKQANRQVYCRIGKMRTRIFAAMFDNHAVIQEHLKQCIGL